MQRDEPALCMRAMHASTQLAALCCQQCWYSSRGPQACSKAGITTCASLHIPRHAICPTRHAHIYIPCGPTRNVMRASLSFRSPVH